MTGYQANHLPPLIFILSPYFDRPIHLKIQHSASAQIAVPLELSILLTLDQATFPSGLELCGKCLLASSFIPQLSAMSRSGDLSQTQVRFHYIIYVLKQGLFIVLMR